MSYFGYGMYQPQVYTFAAKNPSKKSKNGYPVEDLTPWDKAWKYHADKSEEFQDHHSKEAYKYSPKQRGAFGFYDVTTGKQIVVDFTKKQAAGITDVIAKNAKRLDRLTFELTKSGSSTDTVVSLTPVTFPEEDLTAEQRANFDKAPSEFDLSLFDGVVFEMDEKEQIEKLIYVGFDISLVGLERPANAPAETGDEDEDTSEPLPF